MARTPRKSILTSSANTQVERQARRINRQQKQLDRQMLTDMGQNYPATLTNSKGRTITSKNLKPISALTDTQQDFFDAYADGEEAMVLFGSAGTGKTFLALGRALEDVLVPESIYKKVIIVRSVVQGRDMGALPGDTTEKGAIFELPYHAVCADLFGRADAYEKLKDMGKIEFITTSFLRGMTFSDCIIVADEIQNETFATIGTLITRTGKNTKLIIMGDGVQSDLVHSKHDVSGFREFISVSKNMEEFRHFRFTSDDIVRSGICKSWIIQCEKLGL